MYLSSVKLSRNISFHFRISYHPHHPFMHSYRFDFICLIQVDSRHTTRYRLLRPLPVWTSRTSAKEKLISLSWEGHSRRGRKKPQQSDGHNAMTEHDAELYRLISLASQPRSGSAICAHITNLCRCGVYTPTNMKLARCLCCRATFQVTG
ncbi:hypothetical protein BDZ45DRAFT_501740 [Acephala macrosclerotiorum]|nr:hypothetical protein BDZ45DRAFT_501740 [Acephala macrosclerotiorum]